MALIIDSGGAYAYYDADDRHHQAVKRVLDEDPGPLILPMAILAEVDYLLREYGGVEAELLFLEDIASGAFTLASLTPEDVSRCQELIAQYRDLDLGLADAAVMSTAERLGIHRILTVDERDFRAVRPRGAVAFSLLPSDAGS